MTFIDYIEKYENSRDHSGSEQDSYFQNVVIFLTFNQDSLIPLLEKSERENKKIIIKDSAKNAEISNDMYSYPIKDLILS